jgi:hypothetical protein
MKTVFSTVVVLMTIWTVGPASAGVCNATYVNSIVQRMNAIQATSGACRAAVRAGLPAARTCSICRSTYYSLTSLRASYKSNKSCFRSSPRIMARVGQLWPYRNDIKKLRRMCG